MTQIDHNYSYKQYVTEELIRSKVAAAAKLSSAPEKQRENIAAAWIKDQIDRARKAGKLMTDLQYADWAIGRKLTAGDRCRYIGPSRTEAVNGHLIVPREHGQEGFVTSAQEDHGGRLITFSPKEAVTPVDGGEKQYVSLQVREHTLGFLNLERIPY